MLQESSAICKDPSTLRRLTFAATNLPKDTPRYWDLVAKFGFSGLSESVCTDTVKILLENLQFLDENAFATDYALLKELSDTEGFEGHSLGIVLMSTNERCRVCDGQLLVRADRPSFPVIYSDMLGTIHGTHFRKYCSNNWKGCSFTQHYGFHMNGNDSEITYDCDSLDLPYFLSSHMTAFQTKLLHTLTAEILLGQLSYKQKSEIYNYTHGYDSTIKKGPISSSQCAHEEETSQECGRDRQCLDRRRLEEAHVKFCILDVFKRYPGSFSNWLIATNLQQTLDTITPAYYEAFSARYAEHKCCYPGCTNVLIIDGNMKNRRNICAATEAGFIEYMGLPGTIKTGCQQSPTHCSRFCYDHSPRVANMSPQDDTQQPCSSKENVVGIITSKKQTRGGTYYQVAWLANEQTMTWEPVASLPQSLIDEFEEGESNQQVAVTCSSEACYGMVNHSLVVTKHDPTHPPPSKQLRRTDPTSEPNVLDDAASMDLICNTEKDRSRLHHRTAGILAGIRPCGVIVLLTELFTSESKAQVYASLHEFLRRNPAASSTIEYICYDDGCHLRKFARHSSRRDVTPTAQKLASVEIVIDKMHMAGHVDKWCLQNCDPHLFSELDKVDTESCEQLFSWLSRYGKMTRRMSRSTFIFFLLYMCDLHNVREEHKLRRGHYM